MDQWLEAAQWPAMVVTVVATWLVGSRSIARRRAGFWVFLASNVLWIAWGWHGDAHALIVLQLALIAMNLRGMREARKAWRAAAQHAFAAGATQAQPLSLDQSGMRRMPGANAQPPAAAGSDR
ncbi:hypothetical protein VSR17_12350 [Cupriavidus taiwanensis]|uniref:Amino acid transporter n=1 Tax=Cupriavidus taiwanensis TaxID=164546 RepID=A0A375HH19_9BURK|nr:hypothetical protein [Cupriavidus taiwanensis]SOY65088.1 conserved hypothetical protein [Cupriavidus taiwanensis]SOY65334.1 conserved hypothetical protein [Cupriavidus taiwanensis]SOY94169.1 conserved hypothetical protein [Cupriavidus taiwanensis]SOZ27331.1 conserved hypothetical protein [Cupriavidus taiwanensis]SOZ69722.1 conserved hypothetical protein [Cupriavidus taiwanensis]